MAKGIDSTANPVVKTSMIRGKATGKAVASLSKGFDLGMGTKTALIIDCINCGSRRMGTKENPLGVALGRSTGTLSRIMIATLNVGERHGTLNCNVSRIGNRTLAGTGRAGLVGSVTKHIPNLMIDRATNNPSNSAHIVLQNDARVANGGRPLCMISNMPLSGAGFNDTNAGNNFSLNSNVSDVGTSSMRGVSMLGNPTTSTLCNDHTDRNIVLVAAGQTGGSGVDIRCGKALAFSARLTG